MAKRRRHSRQKFYTYECSLTGEEFKVTTEAKNPSDLISVAAYYEMNPDEDDRPESIKIKLKSKEEIAEEAGTTVGNSLWDQLVAIAEKQVAAREALEAQLASQSQQS